MNVQEQQFNFIKEIVELKEKNPSHEIHFMTDTDNWDGEYSWVCGEIISVRIGVWLRIEDKILIDLGEIEEHFWENDLIYSEAHPDYIPELDELKEQAKPSILIKIAG